jgi:hypothetical protein
MSRLGVGFHWYFHTADPRIERRVHDVEMRACGEVKLS